MRASAVRRRGKLRRAWAVALVVLGAIGVLVVAVWLVVRPGPPDATTTLADHGVVGELWLPSATAEPGPGVVVLGGSEGGMPSAWGANAFASEGIARLNVALFGHPGLPDRLLEIPLEQVVAGVDYLRGRPEVDGDRIWLIGVSRGSEAAMLTAAAEPALVYGVVAAVPGSAAVCGIPCDGPAWTLEGEGVASTRMYGATEPWDRPEAAIPAQDIAGRLVTICGGVDDIWPSCLHAEALAERREDAVVAGHDRRFVFEDAGHGVGRMVPAPRVFPAAWFGGPDEQARRDLWPQLIEIIHGRDLEEG